MSEFIYRAVDPAGKSLKGSVQAISEAEAILKIERTGTSPIWVKEKAEGESWWGSITRHRVDRQTLEFFSRQMGTLLQAGIPVVQAFEAMSHDSELGGMGNSVRRMMSHIQGGATISEAMNREKETFPKTYVQMVRAAEVGGVVPETLEQLAEMLEQQRETTLEVKSATRYPMVVLGALIVSFFVLVAFVLPKLSDLFTRFGTDLPLPTRVMLGIHVFLKSKWHFMLAGLAGMGIGIFLAMKNPRLKIAWDRYKIQLPVFGPIFSKVYMERFCQMSKVLLRAGVPVLNMLKSVATTIGNTFINGEIEQLRTSVHAGEPMSSSMRRSPAFTHLVVQMVAMGEKSGRLPELMDLCARHYRREIRYKLKALLSMIEPALTVLIGMVVFFFMLSVFMPIWDTVKFLK